ncbi:MAG: NVEALA domain-containing protein [Prevotellaceae bacterium]|nr:NVEALA domain-containing protein [Prevotellaceae bacterium]
MRKIISAACIVAALLSGYGIYHTSNDTNIDSVVLENIEALANGENSPTSSWFQYMDYTRPCKGNGMKMYCSKNGYSSSCTYHCGKKVY